MGITKILIIAVLFWVAFKVYTGLKSRAKTSNDKKLNQKIIACDFSYFPVEILVNRICNRVAAIIE